MFIRTKHIHGQKYAYLVESVWTKQGSRQKYKEYLGRLFEMPAPPTFTQLPEPPIEGLLIQTLTFLGFTQKSSHKDNCYAKDDITVNLTDLTVRYRKKKCVLKVHEGYIADFSLQRLYKLRSRVHVQALIDAGENIGLVIAQALLGCGISLDEELFISLYEQLVPTQE